MTYQMFVPLRPGPNHFQYAGTRSRFNPGKGRPFGLGQPANAHEIEPVSRGNRHREQPSSPNRARMLQAEMPAQCRAPLGCHGFARLVKIFETGGTVDTVDHQRVIMLIELPQEEEKFGSGSGYLADVMAATQARFSARKQEILRLFGQADAGNAPNAAVLGLASSPAFGGAETCGQTSGLTSTLRES